MTARHDDAIRQLSALTRRLSPDIDGPALRAFLRATATTDGPQGWLQLAPADKVARMRAYRDAGLIESPVEAFYMVAACIMRVAEERTGALYARDFADRFEQIRHRHGLTDDEDWLDGDEPADHLALLAEFETASDRLTVETFREFAEFETADIYARDRAAFDARFEAGRLRVHGPLPPVLQEGQTA